ncbi:MAG: GAF domain-containing protein [Proteobacteria bacterium]|nr:GAF domain-containing protein [Pseudomonadota bacterium]
MRIRLSIRLSIAAVAALALALAFAAFFSSARLAAISAQQARAQDIFSGISELLVLIQEYALHSEQREAHQFLVRQTQLANLLRSAASGTAPAPQEALDAVSSLADSFQRLVDADAGDDSLRARQKNLLLGLAQSNIHLLAESVHRWGHEVAQLRKRANSEFRMLAVGVPLLMLLIVALLGALLERRVLRPLSILEKTMQAAAGGDFNVRSALATKDEMGDVSRAFDRMALEMVSELRREIAERRRSELLLQARLTIFELGKTGRIEDVLQSALDVAEEVTGSRIGFFHFVDADQEHLSLQAWSTNTLKSMCTAEGKGQHYAISEAGVWVDCVRTLEAVIHNDYAGLAHKKGLPEGHARVVRELVVPVVREGRVVEILGVGNKAEDYVQEDVDAVQMIAAMVQDIVERRRAEEALRDERALLAQVTASSPVGIAVVHSSGRITFANDAAEGLLGLAKDRITQRGYDAPEWKHTDIGGNPITPEQLPVARVLATGAPVFEVEHGIEWPDGRRVLLSVNAAPLVDHAGAIEGVVAAITDITERKRSEQLLALEHTVAHALAFEEQRSSGLQAVMRAICRSMNWARSTYWRADDAAGVMRFDAVWNAPELDMEGYVDRAAGMTFAPGEGLVGQAWQSAEPVWIGDMGNEPPWWRESLVSRFEMRAMLAFAIGSEGRTIGALTFASLEARAPDARLIGAMRVVSSELGQFLQRKHAEEQLRGFNADLERLVAERTRALEAANRELESFSYAVSHDLRAPLRTIGGFSGIIESTYAERLGTEGRDYLRRVRTAVEQMSTLIEDMLTLSRISRMGLSPRPVDLSALAQEIGRELQAEGGGRAVEWRIAPGLVAAGDPGLMRIAMQNLLANAWKYSSKRNGARIEFGAAEKDGRKEFFVRDNGAGFDMTQSGRMFQPFQRLHASAEFPGSGVGLATVARVIERHGGQIRAEGAVGEGASFFFTLQ